MFDGATDEVLEFKKEENRTPSDIDRIFEKLVAKDMSFPILMKIKPKLECPKIRLSGIILESPKRKVQLRGLAEFGSLADGHLQRVDLGSNASNEYNNPPIKESRDTLKVEGSTSISQYVAISVKNHELKN